jgi:ribonuclease III
LTHRSASQTANNERLEFLGDAFLNYEIGRLLFDRHPASSEGDLSRQRASLVSRATLAAIGRERELDQHLILGPGETKTGGAARGSLLANGVEALIGALLIDGGDEAARRLIQRLFGPRIEDLPEASTLKDPKTRLQEWLQARGHPLPAYVLESLRGPPHKRLFRISCRAGDAGLQSIGEGSSRRIAEQAAATAMLARLENSHAR